jgi:Cu-Zn family superoxide dismutase
VGTCSPCGAAKGHFDPGPNSNSNPDGNHPFHMGDLENIEASREGKAHLKVSTTRITLSDGPLSLFDEDGSAFIIHVDPDTYCPEGVEKGCAGGARAACGIIKMDRRKGR